MPKPIRLPIRISFSRDRFDQWRLSEVGGRIANHRGKEMFVFDSEMQWQRYRELNKERPSMTRMVK